jgi:hypothetical protein
MIHRHNHPIVPARHGSRLRRTAFSFRASLAAAVLLAVASALLSAAAAQESRRLPKPETVVRTRTFLSLEQVPRGAEFEVAVVAEILPGFHVNANKVLEDYLIPTRVEPALPPGYRLLGITYPSGLLRRFEFSKSDMAVYEGRFTVRVKLKAPEGAPLGKAVLPMTLHYQACNDFACLPPARVDSTAEFVIAAAGTAAKPANPEIFTRRP